MKLALHSQQEYIISFLCAIKGPCNLHHNTSDMSTFLFNCVHVSHHIINSMKKRLCHMYFINLPKHLKHDRNLKNVEQNQTYLLAAL